MSIYIYLKIDAYDNLISGSLNQVQTITDTWTFAKNKNTKTPNWLLVETSD